jgi:hypothetical protein
MRNIGALKYYYVYLSRLTENQLVKSYRPEGLTVRWTSNKTSLGQA